MVIEDCGLEPEVLLCSLFDLLWEVLGAEKVLRRDVEEEEGPETLLHSFLHAGAGGAQVIAWTGLFSCDTIVLRRLGSLDVAGEYGCCSKLLTDRQVRSAICEACKVSQSPPCLTLSHVENGRAQTSIRLYSAYL